MNLIYQIIHWKNILLATGGQSDDLICIDDQDVTNDSDYYSIFFNEIKTRDSCVIESKRMPALRHAFFKSLLPRQKYNQSALQSFTLHKTTQIAFFEYVKSFAGYVSTIMKNLCSVCDTTKNHSVKTVIGDVLENIRNYVFSKNELRAILTTNSQLTNEKLVKIFLVYVSDVYVVYHRLNTYIKENISKCDTELFGLMTFLLNLNYFIVWMHESVLNTDYNVEESKLMNMIWTIDHENLKQLMHINRKLVPFTSFNLLYEDGIISKAKQGNINFTQIYQNWSENICKQSYYVEDGSKNIVGIEFEEIKMLQIKKEMVIAYRNKLFPSFTVASEQLALGQNSKDKQHEETSEASAGERINLPQKRSHTTDTPSTSTQSSSAELLPNPNPEVVRKKVKEFFGSVDSTGLKQTEGDLQQPLMDVTSGLQLTEGAMAAEPLRNNDEGNATAENDELQFLDSAIVEFLGDSDENLLPEIDFSNITDELLAENIEINDENNAPSAEQDENE